MMRALRMLVVAVTLAGVFLLGPVAAAQGFTMLDGATSARGSDQPADLFGVSGIFTTFVNILLFLIGALAVVMLIIGGLRYVLSGGDQAKVTSAKNTILYAIIGVIVAILAYAAINFVITSFTGGGSGGGLDV